MKSLALAKAATKSSSSTGMAGLSALINTARFSAASTEGNRGRCSGSSVGKAHRGTSEVDSVSVENSLI